MIVREPGPCLIEEGDAPPSAGEVREATYIAVSGRYYPSTGGRGLHLAAGWHRMDLNVAGTRVAGTGTHVRIDSRSVGPAGVLGAEFGLGRLKAPL